MIQVPTNMGHSLSNLRIGMNEIGNICFHGFMDDLQIYNRELTAVEIDQYCSTSTGVSENTNIIPELNLIHQDGSILLQTGKSSLKNATIQVYNSVGQLVRFFRDVNINSNSFYSIHKENENGIFFYTIFSEGKIKSFRMMNY